MSFFCHDADKLAIVANQSTSLTVFSHQRHSGFKRVVGGHLVSDFHRQLTDLSRL